MEKMNIYAKLMKVRKEFHSLELKKTGWNDFSKFKYFELTDFLIQATNLLNENGLCTIINFTEEQAILTVINIDNPEEKIQFTSPMKYSNSNNNPVQNLGATQTYISRYLYIQLLHIVENDEVDSADPAKKEVIKTVKKEVAKTTNKSGAKNKQGVDKIYTTAYKKGLLFNEVKQQVRKRFGKEVEELTEQEYNTVLAGYEKMEKKEN